MQNITSLFTHTPELQNFVDKLSQLEQIHHAITSKLDRNLAENCKVSNLRNGILILTTTSPAWNHKLRFQSLDLLSSLRADPRWCGLKSIEVKVDYLPQTNTNSPGSAAKGPHNISKANADIIKQMAASINNEKLSCSLNNLAKHSK